MRLPAFLFTVSALSATLAACAPSSDTVPVERRSDEVAGAVGPVPPKTLPAPPSDSKRPSDLASCPGINTAIRRPAGSNCLGILPQQCGAASVPDIVGKTDSSALRADVARRTGNANVRWIAYGDAVIENLDPARLNIELDAQRRVRLVDCY